MAIKFITNIITGLTLVKCIAIPTGMKIKSTFNQELKRVALSWPTKVNLCLELLENEEGLCCSSGFS